MPSVSILQSAAFTNVIVSILMQCVGPYFFTVHLKMLLKIQLQMYFPVGWHRTTEWLWMEESWRDYWQGRACL